MLRPENGALFQGSNWRINQCVSHFWTPRLLSTMYHTTTFTISYKGTGRIPLPEVYFTPFTLTQFLAVRSRLHILSFPYQKFIRQRCSHTILLFTFNLKLLQHKLNQEIHGCQFQEGFIENHLHSTCERRHCSSYPTFRHWENGKHYTDLRTFHWSRA